MSTNSGGETFIGYAGLALVAAIFGFPALGWAGVLSAIGMIYFGLVLTNGAGTAAKRRQRKHRR
jgi:hypothetical protein